MRFVNIDTSDGIAKVTLSRGKVNALNPDVVAELQSAFRELQAADAVRAVVLTGQGAFFSFGFDVPEFLEYDRQRFEQYLIAFTGFYTQLFEFPKGVVAALNGHAVAGGCMIALACDYRIMAMGNAKTGLNEVTFGASLFAGSVEMLCHLVGTKNAERIMFSGDLYSAEQALGLGLVDEACPVDEVNAATVKVATTLASRDAAAFASIKRLVRAPVAERMRRAEPESIREFTDIWYSQSTRQQLQGIRIR